MPPCSSDGMLIFGVLLKYAIRHKETDNANKNPGEVKENRVLHFSWCLEHLVSLHIFINIY